MTNPREQAIDALERFISQGQENDSYPRATAAECLAALEGQGWRPTEARADPAHWRHQRAGTGTPADPGVQDLLAETREHIDALAARSAAELGHDDPPRPGAA